MAKARKRPAQSDLFEHDDPDKEEKSKRKQNEQRFREKSDEVAKTIIEQMKAGAGEWEMPWHKGLPEAVNQVSNVRYGGKNLLILWQQCLEKSYEYNHWATFKQWQKRGAKVRKGEKGTLIRQAIPKRGRVVNLKNRDRQLHLDLITEEDEILKVNQDFYFKFIHVFNVAQVSDFNIEQPDLFYHHVSDEQRINELITKARIRIKRGGERAFYNFVDDFIQMPEKARFKHETHDPASEKYYSTLLHEVIHWTGHHSRCKRIFKSSFGDKAYAFEELVAEIGGAMLSSQFKQRVFVRDEHAAYLNSWINVLENDFSYMDYAIELARTAILWLYHVTGVVEVNFNEDWIRPLDDHRIKEWVALA